MPTPTTEGAVFIPFTRAKSLYAAAWGQIAVPVGSKLNVVVPYELANVYYTAAQNAGVLGLSAERCTGLLGEDLMHITGES